MPRFDGRADSEMRKVTIVPDINPYAEGSAQVSFGNTTVLVTATLEEEVPEWMKLKGEGWITAEYGMLPRATHTRSKREAASGKQSGRTLEIQRLIGRAMRAAVDLKALGPRTLRIDCDVIVADGGTRTAAISGAWVAVKRALNKALPNQNNILVNQIAALSVGKVNGELVVDLNYKEDSSADFDLNLVFNREQKLIEIQGTAERQLLDPKELNQLLDLGFRAGQNIFEAQLR